MANFTFLTLHAFAKLFTLQVLLLEHGSKPLTNQLFVNFWKPFITGLGMLWPSFEVIVQMSHKKAEGP